MSSLTKCVVQDDEQVVNLENSKKITMYLFRYFIESLVDYKTMSVANPLNYADRSATIYFNFRCPGIDSRFGDRMLVHDKEQGFPSIDVRVISASFYC